MKKKIFKSQPATRLHPFYLEVYPSDCPNQSVSVTLRTISLFWNNVSLKVPLGMVWPVPVAPNAFLQLLPSIYITVHYPLEIRDCGTERQAQIQWLLEIGQEVSAADIWAPVGRVEGHKLINLQGFDHGARIRIQIHILIRGYSGYVIPSLSYTQTRVIL